MSNKFNQRPGAYLTPRQKDFFNSIYEFLVKNNVRTVLELAVPLATLAGTRPRDFE
tara:strand:- start:804 stop:971 length:168 start_codon:yes stop_codon:yes gene_type:complete